MTVTTVNVLGTAQPWSFAGGINAAYPYGDNSGTAAPGITGLIAGMVLTITGTAGTVNCNTGAGAVNANGDPLTITGDTQAGGVYYPTHYTVAKTLGRGGLIGAFVDSTGQLIQAVSLGNGAFTLTVPTGATKLQFGIDDTIFSDNTGSFTVSLTIPVAQQNLYPAREQITYINDFNGNSGTNTTGSGQVFPIGY